VPLLAALRFKTMKILLIENHPHFAKAVVKEFLSEHEVVIAPSIRVAKENLSEVDFDLFLSDYDLDDGKGDEFVLHLREIGNSKPVVAISSHEKGNTAILAAGANKICSKMEFRKINEVITGLQT
jgi:DNA-binding response OmpR family regulator